MKPSLPLAFLAAFLAAVLLAPVASPARAAEGAATPAKAAGHPAAPAAAPAGAKAPAKSAAKGEVTLTGQLTCAKCGLKESSACQNVLRVSDAATKTETKYYLAKNDVAQAHHEQVCGGQVSATVTGRVTEEAGKKVLTATAISLN